MIAHPWFPRPMRRLLPGLASALVVAALACARAGETPPAEPVTPPPMERVLPRVDTVRIAVADPDQQRRITELELQLLERDAQIERLESSLEDTRREVVRSLARLQTTASRAEAASALAEADIALQALQNRNARAPELGQARRLLEMSTAEFGRQNYGGALYLATQVKTLATAGSGRLAAGAAADQQPGETAFAVPVPLQASSRANVRAGPGTEHPIVFTVDRGTNLTGYSYTAEWVRVTDASGRVGWVHSNLVGRRRSGTP